MSKLRALAQWVNNQSINSCEMAQSLVGAAWSTNDRASASICAAIGTSQGIFSDYAAARHGCGSGGQRYSTLAAATGELADQAPINVNYAWEAVQVRRFSRRIRRWGNSRCRSRDDHRHGARDGRSTVPPAVRVLEPLALDREVTEILMEGGGDLPVYACDTPLDCLNPTLGRVTIPAAQGLRARVAGLMRDLVDAVRNDTVPPAPALGACQSHHAAGLPRHQRCRGLPGCGDRSGSGRARRSGGARCPTGVDLGPAPDDRSPRGDARQRRRDAARTLATDTAGKPHRVEHASPGRASAVQHRAGRRRKTPSHRNRARGRAVRGPSRRARVLPRPGRVGGR